MSAKTASLVAKILAITWILGASIFKGLGVFTGLSAWEIVVVGLFIALIFVTVDINILADKFTSGKLNIQNSVQELLNASKTTDVPLPQNAQQNQNPQ